MKFGRPTQNDVPMMMKWSQWKPELEIKYGGRLFSETESSYISAANWPITSKFGTHTHPLPHTHTQISTSVKNELRHQTQNFFGFAVRF